MKKKWTAALLAGILLAALLLSGCSQAKTVKRLRFGAAGEGGIYREFGERFAALQNETDNGTIELKATAGSAANLRLLTGEYLQLAIAQADLAQDACNQTGIFADEEETRGFGAVAALYTEACQVIVRADSGIESVEDLQGKTTANTISSTYAELAEQYGATVTGVDDLNQTFELLNSGRIDATLNAEVTYFDYLKEHPDANIKIAALTNDASQVAFPVRKGDETATLREALNQAINELREDGTIAEISEKYFGTDLSQAPSAN